MRYDWNYTSQPVFMHHFSLVKAKHEAVTASSSRVPNIRQHLADLNNLAKKMSVSDELTQ